MSCPKLGSPYRRNNIDAAVNKQTVIVVILVQRRILNVECRVEIVVVVFVVVVVVVVDVIAVVLVKLSIRGTFNP